MGEGISLRHWLLPHLRRQYHSLLPILTAGREYHSDTGCCLTSGDNATPSCLSSLGRGNITQTLAAASPQETIPLPPVYPHCGEGISLRHFLLPQLRREYHFLLPILTWGKEYHSDTGCCLTSGDNTTPSCLSSLGVGISLRPWLLPHLRREYHSLLPILTAGREYHSDTGCCLTSGENTTPSCLSSLGEGISLRHWLLPHLRREYHSLLSILTHGREYHSDTGCCLTSGDNTTPSCLSSLGEGISLRHWLLPHLRRQYHSLLPILTVAGNITQTLAAASPQETIPLPPAYPHCGEGISLRHWLLSHPQLTIPLPPVYRHSGEGISLRHWLLPHLRRQYHSLLPILTRGANITLTLAAASPQETIPLPPAYPHSGWEYQSDTGCCLTLGENTTPSCLSSLAVGISLRHRLLPHLRREYHFLLPILTRGGNITQTLAAASPQETIPLPPAYPHSGREYHSDTGCCLNSGDNTTPSCLSSLRGGNITQTLAAASPQERIPLPPAYPHSGREYHSDTGCCLTSGENTTPSCLSSLMAGNITQTLAAASPQETIPLPPVYPHSGQGTSLRHWLLPHLRREYHSLLPILTRGGNITQTLAAASPQERIPLPPVYPHSWQGISLRHWLLPHLRRQYHSLLPILTRGGNITQTLAAASPQETIPLPPAYPHCGREYHSDTGCCLTSGDNTTPSCLSSLRGGNITQTLVAASPSVDNTTPSCLSSLGGGNITQTLAAASPQETIPLPPAYPHSGS